MFIYSHKNQLFNDYSLQKKKKKEEEKIHQVTTMLAISKSQISRS